MYFGGVLTVIPIAQVAGPEVPAMKTLKIMKQREIKWKAVGLEVDEYTVISI